MSADKHLAGSESGPGEGPEETAGDDPVARAILDLI